MTDAARKRIDVSGEAHALLEVESRRRGVPIRDLADQAITEMLDRGAQAALSVRQQRERRHADRVEEQTAQLGELGRRFAELLHQQTKDLPAALTAGFEAIKTTIRETGGTGHLRDMIAAFEKSFLAKFDAAQAAVITSVGSTTEAVNSRGDKLEEQIARLEKRQSGRRTLFGAGIVTGLVLLLLVGFVMPDTSLTRWLATRFVGAMQEKDAAWTLAGDGRARGLLMAETKGLLGDEQFRQRYAACVNQAKRVKTSFTCRITFPTLVEATP